MPDLVTLEWCGDPAGFVVGFLNTLDVEAGTDELASRATWNTWLAAQGLAELAARSDAELRAIRELRADLRALARGDDAWLCQVPVLVSVGTSRAVELGARDARGLVAAAAAQLALEQRLARVKICPADDCAWAFYDTSKNQSRQWCSMRVCGNRAKSRNHRERLQQRG